MVRSRSSSRVKPGMTGIKQGAEEALLFGVQSADLDFFAVIFYPVQEATVFYLLFVWKVVMLVDVCFELTVISVPNFVASGEHWLKLVYVWCVFRRYGFPGQARNDGRVLRFRSKSGMTKG